jgi:hypothetical protein
VTRKEVLNHSFVHRKEFLNHDKGNLIMMYPAVTDFFQCVLLAYLSPPGLGFGD